MCIADANALRKKERGRFWNWYLQVCDPKFSRLAWAYFGTAAAAERVAVAEAMARVGAILAAFEEVLGSVSYLGASWGNLECMS